LRPSRQVVVRACLESTFAGSRLMASGFGELEPGAWSPEPEVGR
jgi:hypothetical protein